MESDCIRTRATSIGVPMVTATAPELIPLSVFIQKGISLPLLYCAAAAATNIENTIEGGWLADWLGKVRIESAIS